MRTSSPIHRCSLRGFIALLLLLGAALPALAQVNNRGTLYSRFGVGQRFHFSSSQSQGLGGASAGFMTVNYLNPDNPAAYSTQVFTRFTAGYQFTGIETEDAQANVSRIDNGSLHAIQLGIPLKPGRLGMAFALHPFSRVGYRSERSGILEEEGDEPMSSYQVLFEGGGGLQDLSGGVGYRLTNNLALGASVHFRFGILEYNQRTELAAAGLLFANTTSFTESMRMRGVTATVGAGYIRPRTETRPLRITAGAALTLPTVMTSTRTRIVEQRVVPDTIGVPVDGDVTLPLEARFGVTVSPNPRWLLAFDTRYEPWSQFDSDLDYTGYDGDLAGGMSDSWRFGGGIEFTPAGDEYSPRMLSRISYALGAYTEQSYFNPSPDADVVTAALTAGLGIPSLFAGTSVDINGEIGRRGTTDFGLVRDLYFRVSATINFGERWFVKRRFR